MAGEIVGNYRLLRHIQSGQATQVYEVVETSSHRHFAMKLMYADKAKDPVHRRLFVHEASVGKQLAHPNIIRIVFVNGKATEPYFVMEFFPSGSLKVRMRAKEPLITEKCQDILKQAAIGLAFMNEKGWVHRDVKPDNILVNSAGEAKLIDFAIAQEMPKGFWAKFFWRKQKAQGTRSYMSPEQIRGLALDARADIYSFGATCFEVVTGRTPFSAPSAQELLQKHILEKPPTASTFNPEVTKEFSDLILRMLAKKKEDRPKNFHEVLFALKALKVYKNQAPPPAVQG
jgi:serine/threonine protein kinase